MLFKKRKEIDTVIDKYAKGIDQLAMAKSEVGTLQEGLKKMLPELEAAKKETAEKIVVVDAKKVEVAEKTKVVQAEEAVAQEKKKNADAI